MLNLVYNKHFFDIMDFEAFCKHCSAEICKSKIRHFTMRYATFCLVIRGISQRKMPRITLQANMAEKQRNGITRKKATHQFAYPKIYSTFADEKQTLSATRHIQRSRRNWLQLSSMPSIVWLSVCYRKT